jgi:hypothetical protein
VESRRSRVPGSASDQKLATRSLHLRAAGGLEPRVVDRLRVSVSHEPALEVHAGVAFAAACSSSPYGHARGARESFRCAGRATAATRTAQQHVLATLDASTVASGSATTVGPKTAGSSTHGSNASGVSVKADSEGRSKPLIDNLLGRTWRA